MRDGLQFPLSPRTSTAAPSTADVDGQIRDEMGPLLLVACATVVILQVARVVKPDRGVPLTIIASALGAVMVVSGLGWALGLLRRARESRLERTAEHEAELVRLERLHSVAHALHHEPSESAIHRRLIAHANLVVEHDESDLVVFPPAAVTSVVSMEQSGALAPDASSLEWRVMETGAAAHRTTVERGRACYQVAVPVLTPDGLHAVLTLRRALGSFTAAELDAAAALCGQVGAALDRARMPSRAAIIAS